MKKFLSLLLSVLALLVITACDFNKPTIEDSGKITVVVAEETPLVYELSLDDLDLSQGALSVLLHIKETKGLDVVYEESTYGAYLTKVGALAPDSNGFVSIFTSYEPNWDQTAFAQTRYHGEIKVVSSAVGLSSMSIVDGVVIYIGYVAYSNE